jgi:hypothetical protein
MKKLNSSTFSPIERRMLFRVAHEANAMTAVITAGASWVSEIYESLVFLAYFPRGSVQHEQLSARLRDWVPTESITDCISRIAPEFHEGFTQSLQGESSGRTEYDEVEAHVWDVLNDWRISTPLVQ